MNLQVNKYYLANIGIYFILLKHWFVFTPFITIVEAHLEGILDHPHSL